MSYKFCKRCKQLKYVYNWLDEKDHFCENDGEKLELIKNINGVEL